MNKTDLILANNAHRQYPLPEKKWKYFQEWHNTLFFHWKVPREVVEKNIPAGIELDTIDNTAWVSLVAFEVKNMRFRNLPSIPFVSDFHEINLRTYVIKDGIPGIYFFSIETDKFIEVLLTRMFVGLPYHQSKIKRHYHGLCSSNKKFNLNLDVKLNGKNTAIQKTALDRWLTERHSLYQNCDGKIYRFDIHHKEWCLREPTAQIVNIKYKVGKYFLDDLNPDKLHCSKKIDTIFWGKERV